MGQHALVRCEAATCFEQVLVAHAAASNQAAHKYKVGAVHTDACMFVPHTLTQQQQEQQEQQQQLMRLECLHHGKVLVL